MVLEIENLPFRGGKENIAPDDAKCLKCGKCCTTYEGIPLLPEDFIGDDLEKELRILMSMGLLYIQCRFSSYDVMIYCQDRKCPLLTEKGCSLTYDKRPAACRYFGPPTGKKGMKRINTEVGCISKIGYHCDMWTWRSQGREKILSTLIEELDDEHKGYCW